MKARRCATCKWWSEDDDPGEDGTCVLRLGNPANRTWRTMPNFGCDTWKRAAPHEPPPTPSTATERVG